MKSKKYSDFSWAVLLFCGIVLVNSCSKKRQFWLVESEHGPLKIELVADNITVPFGLAFLPDGKLLAGDRRNKELYAISVKSGEKKRIKGLPPIFVKGDGGLLDILPHPKFRENQILYISHSIGDTLRSTLAISRAILKNDSITQINSIFTALPYYKGAGHYGSRMVFKDDHLYFTIGDRYDLADSAQTLHNHLGKTLRITANGTIPSDNPFIAAKNSKAEIWSYGHRNPQGLALHPKTGDLWLNEHGPKGGDEINIIYPGLNYGWPVICYGIDYDDSPIGQGITHKEGMEQPAHYYTPSIAPSGMEFYTGEKFPEWKNNLFIGALALQHLNRLVIENNKIVHEERLLEGFGKRVRAVKQGPEGYLYLGLDGGMIVRLVPAE
ncbi:MAG: PQQ-dependent sugar dehydrogenase [Flavobacteriaceae bacterium]